MQETKTKTQKQAGAAGDRRTKEVQKYKKTKRKHWEQRKEHKEQGD